MNTTLANYPTLFEQDNDYRKLQDLKMNLLNRLGLVKIRVPEGSKMRVSKTFHEVLQQARKMVAYENGMLHFLKEVHILADSFSLEKNEVQGIRHILLHEKGKKSKWSKPIYSIKLRDVCEKVGVKKITIPGGVSPLCFEEQIVVSVKDKNYFYVTTEKELNRAEGLLLDLKSKKAKTKNKKIMMY